MFKKTVYTTLTVGLALLLLATLRLALDTPGATANMQSVTQSSLGSIVIGVTDDIVSLDPADAYSSAEWEILYNVGSGLLSYVAGTTELAPGLAITMPEISPDGQVYTFTLRSGLQFPDGTDFDASAVKWSIDRVIALKSGPSWMVTDFVSQTQVIDDVTIRFILKEAVAFFPHLVAMVPYYPLSSSCFPSGTVDQTSICGGIGPYVIESWFQGVSMTLQANPDFYGLAPQTPSITVRHFYDSNDMRYALKSGAIDVAWRTLAQGDYQALREDPAFKVIEGMQAYIRYLCFNTTIAPFDDARVRQAFAAAVDREPLAQTVYSSAMTPLYSMVPEGVWAHRDTSYDRFGQRDLSQARTLLQQAGYSETNKLLLDLWYPLDHYGPEEPDLAAELAADLTETGMVAVTLRSADWPTYRDSFQAGTMTVFLLGWYADFPDPDNFTWPFAHSSVSGGLGVFYDNSEMDSLLEAGRVTMPAQGAAREAIYEDIQNLWAEEAPTIPLLQGKFHIAARDDVGDIIISPLGLLPYFTLGPDEYTRYVATSGSDDGPNLCRDSAAPCRTVAHALKWAAPGDTILVAEGAYVENLTVDKPVVLKGGYEASGWTRDLAQHETILDGSGNITVWGDWDGQGMYAPAVITDGGVLKMWYSGVDLRSTSRIGYAESSDGITWTRLITNPVLDAGNPGDWDEWGVGQPSVVKQGGLYEMWFFGGDYGGVKHIGYATSTNGLDWSKHPANPVLTVGSPGEWDDTEVGGPRVVFDGAIYHLWYHGYSGECCDSIGYATSSNGITWTKRPDNPVFGPGASGEWDDDFIYATSVLSDGGQLNMWYSVDWYDDNGIGYVTSADGISWTRFLTGPVLPIGDPGEWDDSFVSWPAVIRDGGVYRMWYRGHNADWWHEFGYATSPDGVDWTKSLSNPVLSPGTPGQWGEPVVRFEPGSDGAVLDGFTVTGGDAEQGSGVLVDGSSAVVANAVISGNVAQTQYGGGVRAQEGATLLIEDSLIAHNSAPSGGGLAAETGSDVTLLRTDVLNNTAGDGGGGIGLWRQSSVTARDCIISGNEVSSMGGGIHVSDTDLDMILDLTNCLVIGNKTYDGGAGIDNWGRARLMNVTLADNVCVAGSCVGGLTNAWASSVATVTNSILWGNDFADLDGDGLVVNYSDIGSFTLPFSGDHNLWVDPLFLDAAGGDYHLQQGSPCQDSGTASGAPDADFEGDLRPIGDGFDMGADEAPLSTTADPGAPATLTYTDTQGSPTTLDIPAGAVSETTTIVYTPKDPKAVQAAPSGLAFGGHAFELEAYYQDGAPLSDFEMLVTLIIHYSDADVADLFEGMLAPHRWTGDEWQEIGAQSPETYTLDVENNLLTLYLMRFSRFGSMGLSINQRLYLPLVLRQSP